MRKSVRIGCFGAMVVFVFFGLRYHPLLACSCNRPRTGSVQPLSWRVGSIPSDGQKNVLCRPLLIVRSTRLNSFEVAKAKHLQPSQVHSSTIELRSAQGVIPLRKATSFVENGDTAFFRPIQPLQPRSKYQLILKALPFDEPKQHVQVISFVTGACRPKRQKKPPLTALFVGNIFVGEVEPPGPGCGTGHAFVSANIRSGRRSRFRAVLHAIYLTEKNKISEWKKLPPFPTPAVSVVSVVPQQKHFSADQEKWPIAYISDAQTLRFGRRSYCDEGGRDALPSGRLRFVIESIDAEGNRSIPRLSRPFTVPKQF